jgi:hypothetical protein
VTAPYPPPGQNQPNPGVTFLGFSGGILALIIAAMILVPVVLTVVCCGVGIFGIATTPDPSMTPVPSRS